MNKLEVLKNSPGALGFERFTDCCYQDELILYIWICWGSTYLNFGGQLRKYFMVEPRTIDGCLRNCDEIIKIYCSWIKLGKIIIGCSECLNT